MIEISDLDVHDDAALRAFYDVEVAAHAADRAHPVNRTFPQLRQMARRPSAYYRRILLAAREGERIVGTADLGLTLQDNLHLAQLEVRVLPEARRRGVGTALHDEVVRRARADGRTTFLGEVHQPSLDEISGATAFARGLGYEPVHAEDHLVLALPCPPGLLPSVPPQVDGYEILPWAGRAPEDVVAAYADMHTQMGRDAPSGEVDHEPVTIDVARIRTDEERLSASYLDLVAAARRTSDGVFGGYTLLHLPHDLDYAVQDDTLVMPGHRGHGLGLALKVTLLRQLGSQHPERSLVHTWNATGNDYMQRINRQLGFRPVELEVEMQRKVTDG
jgi:GNAT superfamily N-acetyltransferase